MKTTPEHLTACEKLYDDLMKCEIERLNALNKELVSMIKQHEAEIDLSEEDKDKRWTYWRKRAGLLLNDWSDIKEELEQVKKQRNEAFDLLHRYTSSKVLILQEKLEEVKYLLNKIVSESGDSRAVDDADRALEIIRRT